MLIEIVLTDRLLPEQWRPGDSRRRIPVRERKWAV